MTHLRKKHHPQSIVAYYCACFTCSCTCKCWCECNSPEESAGLWNAAGEATYDNRYSADYDVAYPSRDQEHILNPT